LPAQVTISQAGEGQNAGLKAGLALAPLLGRPVLFTGLAEDGPRPKPGLGPGGMTLAAAASAVSGGAYEGGLGKSQLSFAPGRVERPLAGDYVFDVARQHRSAAPLSPILETLLLPLAAAGEPSHLIMAGGTHVLGGLTSDELRRVVVPAWRSLGLEVDYTEVAPGFFPQARGEAAASVEPGRPLASLQAEAAFRPREVGVEVTSCGLPGHLAEQALEGALERLQLHGLEARGNIRQAKGSRGLALLVWARSQEAWAGFSSLGQRGGRPGAVATGAVESLVSFLQTGAGLTAPVAAALLPALACASGISRLTAERATRGLMAAARAVEALLPGAVRLDRGRRPGEPVQLRVTGQGLL
jgi:RNA 3'-terminal phosphate cyclase (ATP)